MLGMGDVMSLVSRLRLYLACRCTNRTPTFNPDTDSRHVLLRTRIAELPQDSRKRRRSSSSKYLPVSPRKLPKHDADVETTAQEEDEDGDDGGGAESGRLVKPLRLPLPCRPDLPPVSDQVITIVEDDGATFDLALPSVNDVILPRGSRALRHSSDVRHRLSLILPTAVAAQRSVSGMMTALGGRHVLVSMLVWRSGPQPDDYELQAQAVFEEQAYEAGVTRDEESEAEE